MSTQKRSAIAELMNIFGSAVAAASAVQNGRQPRSGDLRGLGIDPVQFRAIKRL